MNLLKQTKILRAANGAAAGQGTTNGAAIDTKGFSSVLLLAALGDVAENGTAKMHVEGSLDGSTNWTDLEGTEVGATDADDNGILAVEVVCPIYRYVRPVLVRATANSVLDGLFAILGSPAVAPTSTAGLVAAEVHHAPEAGTP